MGLYDRDYYHEEDDSAAGIFSRRDRGQRMMATNIVIVTVAFWIADHLFTSGWLTAYLGLQSDLVEHPLHAYQLVTYALTHARLGVEGERWGLFHILFNMFALWMFGREIEWKYGRMEFLRFYIAAVAFAGLVWVGIKYAQGATNEVLVGASGGVCAILFLYIMNYPKRTLYLWGILGMPAWVLGVGFAAFELISFASPGAKEIAHEAHLAGAAFGVVYFQFGRRLPRFGLGDWRGWLKRLKPRPDLKVHDPETYYHDLDSEADALLAKIHKYGEESLTHEERKKLEDYSRRMRQKHR